MKATDLRFLPEPIIHDYFKCFTGSLDKRLKNLEGLFMAKGGSGELNLSFNSLLPLAVWLAEQVEFRSKSPQEIERLRQSVVGKLGVDIEAPVLTDEWEKLAVDVGAYYGSVFARSSPSLYWRVSQQGKQGANYGQPVITSKSGGELPALIVMRAFMLGIRRYPDAGARMHSITAYWKDLFGLISEDSSKY